MRSNSISTILDAESANLELNIFFVFLFPQLVTNSFESMTWVKVNEDYSRQSLDYFHRFPILKKDPFDN